jgi:hypothetical protein
VLAIATNRDRNDSVLNPSEAAHGRHPPPWKRQTSKLGGSIWTPASAAISRTAKAISFKREGRSFEEHWDEETSKPRRTFPLPFLFGTEACSIPPDIRFTLEVPAR